ncbi:MAG: SDR family oxidoreductase [Hyphomicrobiales bacterium]|nr:MAG: SDR family oxidoreductase [Hyphomicrobiales bacterium]
MTILVTGGTKGIGLAIAERLSKPGAHLVLAFNSDEGAAAEAKQRCQVKGARVTTIKTDVGSIKGCEDLMTQIGALGTGLQHIVHSAAMVYPTNMLDADLEKFTAAMQTNGLSLLYLVQKAMPLLDRGSSIVFISSAGARTARPNYAALGNGKALAESIIRYLVPELAPRGIRINTVAPGLVHTTSVARMTGSEELALKRVAQAAQASPSGRASRDSDYTSVVEFLLQGDAEFIQGQVIHANGGVYVGL